MKLEEAVGLLKSQPRGTFMTVSATHSAPVNANPGGLFIKGPRGIWDSLDLRIPRTQSYSNEGMASIMTDDQHGYFIWNFS